MLCVREDLNYMHDRDLNNKQNMAPLYDLKLEILAVFFNKLKFMDWVSKESYGQIPPE